MPTNKNPFLCLQIFFLFFFFLGAISTVFLFYFSFIFFTFFCFFSFLFLSFIWNIFIVTVMAPFKLRFSKLSKSRSKGSRSSSTECDEPLQQIQHCSISRPETPAIECNTISSINEIGIFPSSPPPSYEHVLQEVMYLY